MHIDAKWVEHSHAYSHKMGKRVNEFFCKKVQIIMDNLQPIEETDINPHYIETEYLTNYRFNEFETLDENKVTETHKEISNKIL